MAELNTCRKQCPDLTFHPVCNVRDIGDDIFHCHPVRDMLHDKISQYIRLHLKKFPGRRDHLDG